MILRQSTAKAVSFGPFVDKTDGVTPEVGLVSALDHGTTGIMLSKNGGALTIRHATVTATTYDAYANYIVTLDTTDTNTVGTMRMQFIETATCLPVWMDFNIVEEAVYDELFAASALGYIANAPVTLADAVAHGGTLGSSTATLALSRLNVTSQTSNTAAVTILGNGTAPGAKYTGGATGEGIQVNGGGTSGSSIVLQSTSGSGLVILPTAGHGILIAADGTGKHGISSTGGTGATSDGIRAVAGTGGVDIRGNITGNITGTLATVTTLTNLPTIPADWLTAAGTDSTFGAEVADAILNRNIATGTDSSSDSVRTLRSAVRQIRNKFSISTGVITYTKEDDSTTSHTAALTTDASADPIIAADPAA